MCNFGISDSNKELIISIFKKVLRTGQTLKIFIFGSRATGTYKPYSDIDFYVEAEPKMTLEQQSTLYDLFEESDLPYKVDLVTKENLLPAFKYNIDSTKKEFTSL